MRYIQFTESLISLVPKLKLGNSVTEALASRFTKLEHRLLGSQSGDWEPVLVDVLNVMKYINRKLCATFVCTSCPNEPRLIPLEPVQQAAFQGRCSAHGAKLPPQTEYRPD